MNRLLKYLLFPSPLGWILMAASPEGICLLDFYGSKQPSHEAALSLIRRHYPECEAEPETSPSLLQDARDALLRYLTHATPLPSLPLDMSKGTPFRQKVWKALCDIPFGETSTYLDIAREIGQPGAPRAVGGACGKNPLAILIPCHRVVAVGGRLGGYTGGIEIKKALLELERGTAP